MLERIANAMDIEKLISEVQKREAIWRSSHGKHVDRLHVSRLWDEISQELNCESKFRMLFYLY